MWRNPPVLIKALLSPKSVVHFSTPEWELCIRQARSSQLLVRLAITLREHSLENAIPRPVLKHLVAAVVHYEHLRNAVRNEVAYLAEALSLIDVPLVLLKGAAYELRGLRAARCRMFNDIDLLVPKARIEEVEVSLLLHGWAGMQQDAYDDHYYRTWMHEIPPLRHLTRLSVVDVHHNIVPDTGSIKVAPDKLLKNIHSCPSNPDIFVLSNQDMILHSAVHLFNDGEFDHGLRDLLDIRDLIHESICTETEWDLLISRAEELGLVKPLVYALRYLNRLFDEPVQPYLDKLSKQAPSKLQCYVMDFLFLRGLQPDHSSCNDTPTLIARISLYLRGHALRMPPHLLLPHLIRKSLTRLRETYFPRREANEPLQP
ncbi:MAG: nucleotidyltransferase family protein [Azonexus sp.]|nr:nucleotidyltransferase family protein [Azonexus sp.]